MSVMCIPGRTYSLERRLRRRRLLADIVDASRRGPWAWMSSSRGRSKTVRLNRSSEARMPCSRRMYWPISATVENGRMRVCPMSS